MTTHEVNLDKLESLIDEYLASREEELADATLHSYSVRLHSFLAYCAAKEANDDES